MSDGIHDFDRWLENERSSLESADIDDGDRAAIEELLDARAAAGRKPSTRSTIANTLRLAAEKADTPLMEMGRADYNRFVGSLRRNLKPKTVGKYKKQLHALYNYHDYADDWREAIELNESNGGADTYDTDTRWTADEQGDLLDAAPNTRDAALVALLFDSKQRIGGIGSLRWRDVDLGDGRGTIRISDDADGTKDASGRVPISWAAAYVADWQKRHPDGDVSDAFVFTALPQHHTYTPDDCLSYSQLRRRWRVTADRAGFDPDRMVDGKLRLHNTRHTGITEELRKGRNMEEVSRLFGKWGDKSLPVMKDVYDGVTEAEAIEDYFVEEGLKDADADDQERRFEACPWTGCQTTLPPGEYPFCPSCRRPLDSTAYDAVDAEQADTFDLAVDLDDAADRRAARDLARVLEIDVDLAAQVVAARSG